MVTGTGRINCVICRKERATTKCAGCLQDFCVNDFTEHHKLLNRALQVETFSCPITCPAFF